MTMLTYNMFEILATFIESYICYQFNDLFIKSSMEKKKCIILSIILTMCIFLLNKISLFSISTLFAAVLFVSLSNYIIFKVSVFDSFSITAFFTFCLTFLDFFSIAIVGLCFRTNNFASSVTVEQSFQRCIFLLFSKTFLVLAYILIRKVITSMKIFKSRNLIFITLIGYIGVVYFVKSTFDSINLHIAISWLLLLIIIILIFFSLFAYMSYYIEVEKQEVISMRNDMLYNNYQEISKSHQKNSILYHDFKNHLLVLNRLLENKDYEQTNIYVKELLDKASSPNFTWTGNDIIDCIINSKKNVCEQFKINAKVDADPIDANLDLFVISSIIPNLLDNAIEACKKCDENARWLSIAVRYINRMVIIKIENSVNEIPVLQGDVLITTKKSFEKHGWGMKSVEAAIEDANGVLNYSFDSKKFTSLVTLFL